MALMAVWLPETVDQRADYSLAYYHDDFLPEAVVVITAGVMTRGLKMK